MKTMRAGIMMVLILSLSAGAAFAIPSLQLNIGGGYYGADETIYSSSNVFDLYAYLIPTTNGPSPNLATGTYYISMALFPKTVIPGDYGSFTLNGTTINVTGDMVYGTPPIETVATQLKDPGDLPQHDIFNTYFTQFSFTFGQDQVTPFNVQDQPGFLGAAGTGMYSKAFAIDVSGLSDGYAIHFDLYNSKVLQSGDVDINNFAPFSHDAQSGPPVPEPSTMLLLGSGLVGLAGWGRKKFRK